MDSFERLIGKNIDDVSLNESSTFFIAPIEYNSKLCGRRYPSSKFTLADIDYFNLIPFSQLFQKEAILIVWYRGDGVITDLEVYHLSNDFDVLVDDYCYIKKAIDDGEAHNLREGDTHYLGASRLSEKVSHNSHRQAHKREFVLKKKYLQKIINEMEFSSHDF